MMLVTIIALAVAAPNPRTLDAPRKAYSACIRQFETRSLAAKMEPAAYSEAIKGACPAESAALTRALVDFDIAMGSKRAAAASNAAIDVGDYLVTSDERYRDIVGAARSPKPQ